MAGKKEVFVMRIKRTISGPKRNTPSTYGQELSMAKNVVESTLSSKNKQLIEYILSVAKLKIRGDNFFATKIKKLSDRVMINGGVLMKKTRRINLYIYNMDLRSTQELIDKARSILEVNKNAA